MPTQIHCRKMTMTTWNLLSFGENVKPHVVCTEMFRFVLDEMEAREFVFQAAEEVKEWCYDHTGMVISGRPWRTYVVDNLKVELPCEVHDYFSKYLLNIPIRKNFYKIHSSYTALCLNQRQMNDLITQVSIGNASAIREDDEFFANWKNRAEKINASRGKRST